MSNGAQRVMHVKSSTHGQEGSGLKLPIADTF